MRKLIVLGVVGLLAQLIDGSLGMAYGVTSSTLLLAVGVAPAAASAAVHFSEIGTSLDRKSTRLNSSHIPLSRMPSSA